MDMDGIDVSFGISWESCDAESCEEDDVYWELAFSVLSMSYNPRFLVARDEEHQEISQFLDRCERSGTGGGFYVAGVPGTGKTSLVTQILLERNIRPIYCNCATSAKTEREFYEFLVSTLAPSNEPPLKKRRISASPIGKTERSALLDLSNTLENFFLSMTEPVYMVMDEVDYRTKIITSLFKWTSLPGSKLIAFGLSNSAELPSKAFQELREPPHTLLFRPYTKEQISAIISARLSILPNELFEPRALQLLSSKAAESGDIRKAFDTCVIALGKERARLLELKQSGNSNTQLITAAQVLESLKEQTGTATTTILAALPSSQQEILWFSAKVAQEEKKTRQLEMVFKKYQGYLRYMNYNPADKSTFIYLCECLVSAGLLSIAELMHR